MQIFGKLKNSKQIINYSISVQMY